MRRTALLGATGLALLLPEIAPAAVPAIRVEPTDLPIEIHATLGEPDTFSVDLTVTAVDASVADVQLRPSRLTPAAGGNPIRRKQTTLEQSEPDVPQGEPVDLTIKVEGIERAGTGSKIYDYLALVVWGLSAEVAQRTLTNLRGSAA